MEGFGGGGGRTQTQPGGAVNARGREGLAE